MRSSSELCSTATRPLDLEVAVSMRLASLSASRPFRGSFLPLEDPLLLAAIPFPSLHSSQKALNRDLKAENHFTQHSGTDIALKPRLKWYWASGAIEFMPSCPDSFP
jgi:hypothetical protein